MCYICSMKLFKDRLAFLMEHFDLSQSDLAERSGVSRSSIGHMLNGRNQPSMDFLAGVLQEWPEIDADWLVMGKGPWKRSVRLDQPEAGHAPAPPAQAPDSEFMPDAQTSSIPENAANSPLKDSEDGPVYFTRSPDLVPNQDTEAKEKASGDELLWVLFPDGTYQKFTPRP